MQDAFVKAYTHIGSFQRNLSFEVWLTRILINGCLDRQKARSRRVALDAAGRRRRTPRSGHDRARDAARRSIARRRSCWRASGAISSIAAVQRLPDRQRLVFMLCHYADHSTRDVAEMTGLNESTVRVHLVPRHPQAAYGHGRTASCDLRRPHRSHLRIASV